MPQFEVTYIREQCVYRMVEADDEEDAKVKMLGILNGLSLESDDDESDDEGEFFVDGPYE